MENEASIEDLDEVTKKISVSIPAAQVSQQVDEELGRISKTVTLKGFRPGKAPVGMVKKMHGPRIRADVANRLVSASLYQVIQKNELDVVGSPTLKSLEFDEEKDIEFIAEVSILPKPEVTLNDKYKVEVPEPVVTDEDVDAVLGRLRESKATPRKLEFRNEAKSGDVIDASILVEGASDGERPEPITVALGGGELPEDLEAGIEGMEIGSTKEIPTKMADDHPNAELSGKTVNCRVTLNNLLEKVLPELDDDFAKSLDFGKDTLLELRLHVREQLETEKKEEAESGIRAAVLEQLIKDNEFLVPQVMIDEEIRNLVMRSGVVDPKNVDWENLPVEGMREQMGPSAETRVRTALLVDSVANELKIEVGEDAIQAEIERIAASSGSPKEQVAASLKDEQTRRGFSIELARKMTVDSLRERADVTYTKPDSSEAAS